MRSLNHVAVSCKPESDLGFGACPDPTYGRFLSVDPLWGKHTSRQPYHYALNTPTAYVDFTGLDSTQRAIIVSAAEDYIGSGSTYLLSAKGPPGKPVDCSGLVNYCMIKAGEQSTLDRRDIAGTGVQRIEKAGVKVEAESVVPGNVVTFRTSGWGYHTGVIVSVTKSGNGKLVQMEFIHSSSGKNGPVKSVIRFDKSDFWMKAVHGFYKVDSKPESTANSPTTQGSAPGTTKATSGENKGG
jgi:cell wall-associated NlpC family hydrolase